ncbi:PH-like domain-containing protein [Amycolatopsis pithecellobii]|uniref:Transporter n=1 Tax=Amycolatopsis pithecellobii TaxID=664692 RepID=A0A6N7Z3W3_9PSEU|nr:transporter [Amycolatopsis pithecellobii]MTD55919.1 transporter [Amycolatopsis pithecellobii]
MERFILVLVVVACFLLALWGMRLGWRRRARSQSVLVPPFPQVPEQPGEPGLEAPGLYVSTTTAGDWQNRIVTRGMGLRGRAVLRRFPGGVEVDRAGAPGFWIPQDAIVGARRGSAIAGKVMGTDSLLIITWRLGEVELDTGFRGDDHGDYPQWIQSLGHEVKGGAQ